MRLTALKLNTNNCYESHLKSVAQASCFPAKDEEDSTTAAHDIIIISKPVQCCVIIIIFLVTVVSNCSIILIISKSKVKSGKVSFILMKHLCIVDLCGAVLILPVPFLATIRGKCNCLLLAFTLYSWIAIKVKDRLYKRKYIKS